GSRFLPFARQALEAIQKGVDAAEQSPEIHSGILRAGVLRAMTGALVSTALQKLLGRYPSLDCQIQEGNHWQLVEWLHDNKIELGLVAWPSITPELSEMTSLLQFREPMVLLAHKNHPLAKKKEVTVADVEKMSAPFLLLKWWQVTPDIVSRLTERASHAIEVPTDTGRYLISKGIGAGFFNRGQVTPELIHNDVVEINIVDLPPIYRQSALVRLSRRSTLSAGASHFAECLATEARKLEFLLH
ncbi:MAG: LysR family transcriptional regulator substrate-binding protein, partial [Chloroflexota bacterium]